MSARKSELNLLLKACAVLGALALSSGIVACKSGEENVQLSGAGSTFVYPVMTRWIQDFSNVHKNVQINYQSIGSGGGIQQVKIGTVDFGASDYALTDEQISGMKPVIQIPESAGPVCITYNLPNLTEPLKISGATLAKIYLGTITSWTDPELAKENAGVKLPATKIVVVHRAESSGTTNAFTTYLAAVSPDWNTKVGKGGSVQWPVGLGGKGSEGVTGQVRQTPGSIGYVELTYAEQNKLPIASIGNQAGKYIQPNTASTTAAIAAFADQLAKDVRTPIVNAPASAPDAYPISTLTFLIIPKDGTDAGKRKALRDFVQYVIGDGQNSANSMNYAPLPDAVKSYDTQQLNQMTVNGQPIQ